VPLIIRAPWLPQSIGKATPALAEAVDLFQTFIDLSGLGKAVALPSDQVLQGTSLLPILRDPPATGTGPREYAFSQFAKSLTYSHELDKVVPWDTCASLFHRTHDLFHHA
jgi:arylsulfatase A-like enzyme